VVSTASRCRPLHTVWSGQHRDLVDLKICEHIEEHSVTTISPKLGLFEGGCVAIWWVVGVSLGRSAGLAIARTIWSTG
jgi:hypothetical protein